MLGNTLSPTRHPDSPLSVALRQPMLLGLFLPIQTGGWSASTLPRTTTWTFDYNAALTLKAEELGFDLVFGLAQWLGKGGFGGADYQAVSMDAFVTSNALASITKRIMIVSTLHILFGPWHPLMLAKFASTLDHISQGRWGINVVTGHRDSEHRRFGKPRIEHDLRYAMADEFLGIMNRLWSEDENLTVRGEHWAVEDAFLGLKPKYGRPILVNATGSPAGIDFAARHSDIIFTTSPAGAQIDDAIESLPPLTARIRQAAARYDRDIRTLVNPIIICRETEREALAYRDAIVAAADQEAIAGFARETSDAHAWRGHQHNERAIGANIQIIGSPEQVVNRLIGLKKAGVDGVQLCFYDFAPDLDFFGERVLPLMKQAGLRL